MLHCSILKSIFVVNRAGGIFTSGFFMLVKNMIIYSTYSFSSINCRDSRRPPTKHEPPLTGSEPGHMQSGRRSHFELHRIKRFEV